MLLTAVVGLIFYLMVFNKSGKSLIPWLFKAVLFVSILITIIATLNTFSVSGKTFVLSSKIISKEKEKLKDRSFSYYLTVNTSNHGEQRVWVNVDTFAKAKIGESLRLTLSENMLGYDVVIGFD